MPYIQLSKSALPSTALRTSVFPFLFQDGGGGGSTTYCIALLVSDRNRMAQGVLNAVGFSPDQSTPLPGGDANDLWTFYRSNPASMNHSGGPFGILTDGTAPDPHALATYLTFGTLTAVQGLAVDIRQPNSVKVNAAVLDAQVLNQSAKMGFFSINFDWSSVTLSFAAAPNTTDQTAVRFQLPAVGVVPRASTGSKNPVKFNFLVGLDALADSGGKWGGSILRLNTLDLAGGPDDRFPLDGAALVTSGGVAFYEYLPTARWSIPIGSSGLFQVTMAVQSLRLRFQDDEIGLYLLNSATGSAIQFRVDLKFPLIMAPLNGAAAEALALVIPLLDGGGSQPPALRWGVSFVVGSQWDTETGKILSISNKDDWLFNPDFFRQDWPIGFVDRSHGMTLGGLQFSLAELLGDALGPVSFDLQPSTISSLAVTLDGGKINVPLGLSATIAGQRLSFSRSRI